MICKRIIPCLDIREGRTVKGVQFQELRDAGDPLELALRYVEEGADELVFLDITAGAENRGTRLAWVERVAAGLTIPFTVGGGIRSVEEAADVIRAGADKVSLNSAAVAHPALISGIADRFGRQCVVLAIDTRHTPEGPRVYVKGGQQATPLETVAWAREGTALGAGEILLTSMDQDGVQAGYDLDITAAVAAAVSVPVIASGGAGEAAHFRDVFTHTRATGALAASIFHFGILPIPQLKSYLRTCQIHVR